MKTFFRCLDNYHYTFQSENCPKCGSDVEYPYPARFSLVKEQKYRYLIRKSDHNLDE